MRIKATGADPLVMIFATYMAFDHSALWLIAIPLVIAGWFIHPRYDSEHGWRFRHDDST